MFSPGKGKPGKGKPSKSKQKKPQARPSYYVSIPLSGHPIVDGIQKAINRYGRGAGIAFTPSHGMHITICHLGNNSISRKDQAKVIGIIEKICENQSDFELQVTGDMDFGRNETFGKLKIRSKAFDALQEEIVDRLKEAGFSPSALPAHISISRQPGAYGKQKPYNNKQKEVLTEVANEAAKIAKAEVPVNTFNFYVNKAIIETFKLNGQDETYKKRR